MRIVETNVPNLKYYKRCKYSDIIEEFVNSDMKQCEVLDLDVKNPCNAAYSLRTALKNRHVNNVDVVNRNGNIYMLKRSLNE